MPQGKCSNCGFTQFKQNFSTSEWTRKEKRWCLECVQRKVNEGTPFQCRFCDMWKCKAAFGANPERQWMYRRCVDCVETRKCKGECEGELTQDCFTAKEWKEAYYHTNRQGTCKTCMKHSERGSRRCTGCGTVKARETEFSTWLAGNNRNLHHGNAKCNTCIQQTDIVKKGQWRCTQCEHLGDKDTSFSMWLAGNTTVRNHGKAKCNGCMAEKKPVRGHWQCKGCSRTLPRDIGFAKWLSKRTRKVNDGTARCDRCIEEAAAKEQALNEQDMQQVQKKRRF